MASTEHEKIRHLFRLPVQGDNFVEVNAPQQCTLAVAQKLRAVADYIEKVAQEDEERRTSEQETGPL